jgi:hypothetical protein
MSRPWTLPGTMTEEEYLNNGKEKEVTGRTPGIYDFDTINESLQRIKKEKEDTENGIDVTPKPQPEGTDAYYPSYYAQSGGGTLGFKPMYEHMELMLDADDKVIDPRIQKLIEKYGLKLEENESLQKYRVPSWPPNRVLP